MKRILFTSLLWWFASSYESAVAQAPVITQNPQDQIACLGSPAQFTVAASNSPTSYQWQFCPWAADTSSDLNWFTIPNGGQPYTGATTTTLSMNTVDTLNGFRFRCRISNAGGTVFSNTALLTLHATVPLQPVLTEGDGDNSPICQGSNDLRLFAVPRQATLADSYTWSYTGTGVTYGPAPDDTLAGYNFTPAATSGSVTVTANNACGSSALSSLAITISPLSSTLAGTAGGGPACNYSYVAAGAIASDGSCSLISGLTPSGANPVQYRVQSCVTVDAAVPSYQGVPYVQRHYNINPDVNAATSTATLTLYFTQADFDAYNLVRGSNPALPASSTDGAGIANLRVTQFHGTGTDPGTYVGGSGDIDPDDNNIVWNAGASRWEVTFNITGFSGFFVSGSSLVPLPLTLVSFTGQSVADGNLLTWITSSEENTRNFEVQRDGGSGFQPLAVIPAAGNSHQNLTYSYTDPLAGNTGTSNSYRLKMTDLDGKFTYSKVVVLESPLSTLSIRILPNPFYQPLSLTVSSPQTANGIITVTDISGKLLLRQNSSLQKGENNLDAGMIANLPKGMYLFSVITEGQKQTVKFVKE